MAATANCELENKNYWLAGCNVYALVGCDRSDHGELGSKNYLLTCNVNALVAATANRELESKHYSLACDVNALVAATANRELETKNYSLASYVYALVGRDRRWRAGK